MLRNPALGAVESYEAVMSPHRPNKLLSHKLTQLPPPQQYFAYAEAYLDSAQRLCGVLARSTRKATFERSAVVLYLTHHALELFYKGAILKKAPTEHRPDHDLQKLRKRYRALYPANRLDIPAIFVTSYNGLTKQQIAQLQGLEPPLDQLYRYPEDNKGKPWSALLAFDPLSFSQDLRELRASISKAHEQIDG
jgi:hypothetical protein